MKNGEDATNGETGKLISEVNDIRKSIGPRSSFRNPEFLKELATKIKSTQHLCKQPIVQCFIKDVMAFDGKSRLINTKNYINKGSAGNIFSLFDSSYFPSLSLEYLTYKKLPVNNYLRQKYPSHTMPVNIEHMSKGFESRIVVALFPENHIDHLQCNDDSIFYFINKFVERHKRITQKMIGAIVSKDAFQLVRKANDAAIEKASTYWVWLHEYHHRHGDMPITEYLSIKSPKPLAGLEELRVDVSGMLVCLNDKNLPADDAALAYEFILSERLLRYAVEGIPKPNYDAVSSQVLFNYLLENGGISLQEGIIHLAPNLPHFLEMFLEEIKKIECLIHQETPEDVQKRLLDFVNKYTVFDQEINDYKHIPFFEEVKKQLNV
ncbi:MAG TPA: DUF6421 family protein [Candidatus Nanoarchaeia archaeon]|nr:DUF6421 family protein [Candidatus Nanoarchaeia archaeon]